MTVIQKIEMSPVPATVMAPTIFHEDWWLNVATNGMYQVAEVTSGGKVVGRLPYCLARRCGMKWAALPVLTHFIGPAVDEGPGSVNKRFINRLEITRELLRKLPEAHFMQIKCHRDVQDVIPFQEQHFRTSVQFTHEIYPAPKETLWANLRHERRRVVTRAEETLSIAPFDDIPEFIRFYRANLAADGIECKLDMEACGRIIAACKMRQRGEILAAKDQKGGLQAAIFCAWDSVAMYYLLTTRAQSSGNGAVSALIWRAIQDASSRQLIFDLDGLSSHGSIMFFAGFGGIVRPRYVATKASLPIQLAQILMRPFSEDQWFI